jgi:hypothetical protein
MRCSINWEGVALLYVATVHHKSPRWIDIQASHLREHISVPFQTWSSLEGIDDSYATRFDRVLEQRGPLAGKLNHLAREISYVADEADLIMFLDGDAFPIADPIAVVTDGLQASPLVAVRRAESLEPQPHPCFCVTTVGTWRSLPGDWSTGWAWPQAGGQYESGFGANLLRTLELSQTPWVKLQRTNATTSDPLRFAIYADCVYHHGAGFRDDAFAPVEAHTSRPHAARGRARRRGRGRVLAGVERTGARSPQGDAGDHESRQTLLVFQAIERGDPGWLPRVRAGAVAGEDA